MGSWSLEGVALAPQQLTAATLPQMGGKGEPDGLLGSDVLSRFGAVRIDFTPGRGARPAGAGGRPAQRLLALHGPDGPAAGGADAGGDRHHGAADRHARPG